MLKRSHLNKQSNSNLHGTKTDVGRTSVRHHEAVVRFYQGTFPKFSEEYSSLVCSLPDAQPVDRETGSLETEVNEFAGHVHLKKGTIGYRLHFTIPAVGFSYFSHSYPL